MRVRGSGKTLASLAEDAMLLGPWPQQAHSRCWGAKRLEPGERPASGTWVLGEGQGFQGSHAGELGEGGKRGYPKCSDRRTGG